MFEKLWGIVKSPGFMAILTLAAFSFGIYGTLFYEKHPGLTFEIASNSSVYDVHTNVGKLDILYAGEDLRKSNQILRLVTFRIINSGKTDIVQRDYDDSEPLGFKVKGGKILEIPQGSGSNDYLQRHLHLSLSGNNQVSIGSLILESGEYINVQALILSPIDVIPAIVPIGKIAGIKKIEVIEPNQIRSERALWERLTEADALWLHLLRAPLYTLLLFLIIICIAFVYAMITVPYVNFSEYRGKKRREAQISTYSEGRLLSNADREVLDWYKKIGEKGLVHLSILIDQLNLRNSRVEKLKNVLDQEEIKELLFISPPIKASEIEELVKNGLMDKSGLSIIPDPDLARAISDISSAFEISLEDEKKKGDPYLTLGEYL